MVPGRRLGDRGYAARRSQADAGRMPGAIRRISVSVVVLACLLMLQAACVHLRLWPAWMSGCV